MVAIFPDGQYNYNQAGTWGSETNDRVMWERTFATGTEASRKMAVAAMTADPSTPADMIRANLTSPLPSELPGIAKISPTLDDVLSTGPTGYTHPGSHLQDSAPTDFSGTNAGRDGTSYPSISAY